MLELLLLALLICLNVLFDLALVTYALFWYETGNSSYRTQQLAEISEGKTGRWILRGIFSSFFSMILVFAGSPLRYWKRLWHPLPNPGSPLPSVILVHGLYHNASAWVCYRWWLRRFGFTNVYAMEYRSFKQSFAGALSGLQEMIEEVSRQVPERKIILIGHSLGGLLCRAYLAKAGQASRIAAVITLATPHQGTKLAALGVGRLARSLSYRGPVIAQLEQHASNQQIPKLAIYSPVDNMIHPHAALHVKEEGWTEQACQPISHTAMLYDRQTAQLVLQFLDKIVGN